MKNLMILLDNRSEMLKLFVSSICLVKL